jgi:hypothetical protein
MPDEESEKPDWQSIRRCAELGVPLKTVAEKFGVNYEAVKKRNQRENWLTPAKLDEVRAQKLAQVPQSSPDSAPLDVVTGTVAEMGQELQTTVLSKTLAALKRANLAALPIESWGDAKTAVEVGLKVSGLESQAQGPSLNVLFTGATAPLVEIDARESVPHGTIDSQEPADIL